MEEQLKQTCLHDLHVRAGARMSPFAGYDMPIQYSGIIDEHNAVRNHAGVFDVSHMGEIFISGADAEKFVNHIFTNDVRDLAPGKILYGMLLYEDGGTVDDLLVYREAEPQHYLLVVNASNIAKDFDWIVLKFYEFCDQKAEDGSRVILSRTGYTGEDGFEIYASPANIRRYWEALMSAGVKPCGLGCRDTLRFEAGLPLYGDELGPEISPVMAGLSMFCKLDKPEFIGRDALVAQKAAGPARKIVGIELQDNAVPRAGYPVELEDGTEVGKVTTGYHSISLDKSLCFALVDSAHAALGTPLNIRIRKRVFPGTVVKKRFYQTNYKK